MKTTKFELKSLDLVLAKQTILTWLLITKYITKRKR